jgi:hypothetical protein
MFLQHNVLVPQMVAAADLDAQGNASYHSIEFRPDVVQVVINTGHTYRWQNPRAYDLCVRSRGGGLGKSWTPGQESLCEALQGVFHREQQHT